MPAKPLLPSRINLRFLLILYFASIVVRFVYLAEISDLPTVQTPVMDEAYHIALAQQITSPQGLPSEPYFRAPLYPYFLAGLYAVTGGSLFWCRAIQILLGSLLPILIYLLARYVVSEKLAKGAALAAIIYPTFIYHDAALLITFLKTILAVLLLLQLYRTERKPDYRNFIISGIILGLAGLARPNFLIIGPALAIWLWLVITPGLGWRTSLLRYAALGIAAVLVIAPVTTRNYMVSHEFVPISWQGGLNFYLGNHRAANGWSATAPDIDPTWEGGYRDAIVIAEKAGGRKLTKAQISDYWYDRGWAEISADPGHFVGLLFRKVRLFFNGYEVPNNEDMYVVRDYSWFMKPLIWAKGLYFPYGLVAPFAVLGFLITLTEWRRWLLIYLFIFAYAGSFLFFFVCARYRMPLVPLDLIFAAVALSQIATWNRKKNLGRLGLGALVIVVMLLESNHNLLGVTADRTAAENELNFGLTYYDRGDMATAETRFKQAIAFDSTVVSAHINLAIIYSQHQQYTLAERHYRTALRLEPGTIDTYLNLSAMQVSRDDLAGAASTLELGGKMNPNRADLWYRLSLIYSRLGKRSEARAAIGRALSIEPGNASYLQLQESLGRSSE